MKRLHLVVAFAILVLALAAAGCGGSDDSSSSAGTETASTSGGDEANGGEEASGGGEEASGFDAAPFEKLVSEAAVPPGFPKLPPTTPKKGAKVAALTCPLELEGCKIAADGQQEAAKVMGLDLTVIDTEGKPEKTVSAFEQAKQLGYEGLTLLSLDPNVAEPYIAAARKRGVPVVTQGMAYGEDYNEKPSPTGPSVEQSREEERMGEVSAANLILNTDGEAKVLFLSVPEFATLQLIEAGFKRVMEQCSTCEIVDEIKFTGPDTTTTLPTQVKAKLTADPSINAVWVGSDAFLTAVNPTVEQLGNEDVHTYATDGQVNNIEIVAEGGVQSQDVSVPSTWLAWGMVDNLNRLIQGEEPLKKSEIPVMAVTEENAEEFLNEFANPIDFKAGFEETWGLK